MAVHFTGPVLNAPKVTKSLRQWHAEMPLALDPDYIVLMDDFTGVAVDSTNAWTVVKDTGAAVAIAADTVGGELTITSTATTDDDGGSIQGNEIFLPASGKDIWVEFRLKGSSVADMDIFVGLSQNFATNPEAVLTASNRIGFQVNDGNASVLCKTEAADSETSTDSGVDMADATYIKLGFHVMGTGAVEFYVNRKLVATHTATIPTTEMALAAFSLSGSTTGTRTMTLDYVFAAQTR